MASDEELARSVARIERDPTAHPGDGRTAREELEEYKRAAGEIHDELARRIGRIDETTPDEGEISAVIDRLDRLENRLDDLESRL